MAWKIRLKPSAKRGLARVDSRYYDRVLEALVVLRQDPYVGKRLRGTRETDWSYRVWPYRIIYQIYRHELLVLVVDIGHRQGVY